LDTDNCTSGFTAQSISDSTLYLLTAGHCVASSTAQWYGFIPGSFYPLPIGPRWRWVNGHSGDAASIQIASSSYWLSSPAPRGWVVVRPSSSTTANDRYPIYTEGYSSLNMPICLTGVYTGATGSGTYCGIVVALDRPIDYGGGVVVDHLGQANLCNFEFGASGGPLYKMNVGYGLLSGGNGGACRAYYQGLVGAEGLTNTRILLN